MGVGHIRAKLLPVKKPKGAKNICECMAMLKIQRLRFSCLERTVLSGSKAKTGYGRKVIRFF